MTEERERELAGLHEGDDDEGGQLGTPAPSILDQVNAARDERLVHETVKMAIPSWGGDMIAEYRVLPRKFTEETGKRSARGDTNAEMDFIARACVSLWVKDPESGKLIQLETSPGSPMRYTRGVLSMLGKESLLEGKKSEEEPYVVIRHLMNHNEVAIATHAGKVMNWMTDTSQEVDGQVEGT
jgi:hypothetical protein